MDNSKLTSALIGGCTFGVAAALPYLSTSGVAVCALYIGGGVLSAYLFLRGRPPTPRAPYGDGAVVGLLAGLLGGVAATIVGLVVELAGLGQGAEAARAALEQMEQTGFEMPAWALEAMGLHGVTPLMVAARLVTACVGYAIGGCIGGVVGVTILHKKET